jgi:hypothetical protein
VSIVSDERVEELLKNEKEKDAEIERLKALVKDRMYDLKELNELKSLLTRAADALQAWHEDSELTFDSLRREEKLVAELRKAAE